VLGFVVAAALGAGGWIGAARASDETEADAGKTNKNIRVVVTGEGDEPQVYVSGDDDHVSQGAYLGVSIAEDTKSPEGGARVESVVDDSPADKAGIERGDVIVGFGGAVIRGPARLTEQIHATKPGDRVDVKVVRKSGKTETVSVELGDRPKARMLWFGHDSDAPVPVPLPDIDLKGLEDLKDLEKLESLKLGPKSRHLRYWSWRGERPRLGVELVETTPELREHLGGGREAGVLVGKVLSNTPAQRSGVKVGDLIVSVDGTRVESADELIEALEDKEGKTIDLEVVRDRRTQRLQVAIPKQDEEDEDRPSGPRAWWAPAPPAPPAPPAVAPAAPVEIEQHLHVALAELAAEQAALEAAHEELAATAAEERMRHSALQHAHQSLLDQLRRAKAERRRMEDLHLRSL
jgi:membrane-associated protease RseP (regulator of RpoE activity)